jgi:hypothetical protein
MGLEDFRLESNQRVATAFANTIAVVLDIDS